MTLAAALDADVSACPRCQSPVFHDELYCEACGRRMGHDAANAPAMSAPSRSDRDEHDAGAIAGVTDRGNRRQRNEDALAVAANDGRVLAVVCDGVASTAHADRAARQAADAAFAILHPLLRAQEWPAPSELNDLLRQAFQGAQSAVLQVPDDQPDGNDLSPSTTMVVAVAAEGRVTVANIGDSRAYWVGTDPSDMRLLTVDDSWAQESIAEGETPEVAYAHPDAHTITRWIGGDADSVLPTVSTLDVSEPGLLVVCTDGLWNYFEDPASLGALIPDWVAASPLAVAQRLTEAALAAGGQDNITVTVAPINPATASPRSIPTEE